MSGSKKGSLVVAASIGAVEALKDQLGVCRWNYALSLMKRRAKIGVQSYYQNHIVVQDSVPTRNYSTSGMKMMMGDTEKINKTEKTLKKVMELDCFGPSTFRF